MQSHKKNLINLEKSLRQLEEVLAADIDMRGYIIDATTHRFKLCIELFWKNFKNIGVSEGNEVNSPKQALVLAYKMKWIDNETLWLQMLNDRNTTSHTYKKYLADKIYANIKTYAPELRKSFELLKKNFATI